MAKKESSYENLNQGMVNRLLNITFDPELPVDQSEREIAQKLRDALAKGSRPTPKVDELHRLRQCLCGISGLLMVDDRHQGLEGPARDSLGVLIEYLAEKIEEAIGE